MLHTFVSIDPNDVNFANVGFARGPLVCPAVEIETTDRSMTKKALIIVDLQNDYFPGGKWVLEGIEKAASNAARLIMAAREAGIPVIHVRHESTSTDAPFFVAGTPGANTHDLVRPAAPEPIVLKHSANSFKDTDLAELLNRHGVEEVTICGAMSQMCIDATTRAAADIGYACTVVHDACAARGVVFDGVEVTAQQVHTAFMGSLGFGYAKIIGTDEYLTTQ
jgi:nicotinamidase-related amidase